MKIFTTPQMRRLGAVAALGVVATMPLAASLDTAHAAPALGHRETGRRQQRAATLTGIVTRDLSGDLFQMRTAGGDLVRVILHRGESEPLRLSTGDRVEVRGHRDHDIFVAHDVNILHNAGSQGEVVTLRGVVVRDFYGREFQLRSDTGRTFLVRSLRAEPLRLSGGDRVEVRGRSDKGFFVASDVDIVRNDDFSHVDFPGRVVALLSARRLQVRADNGRVYTIKSRESLPRSVKAGDRVRVVGYVNKKVVAAERIIEL